MNIWMYRLSFVSFAFICLVVPLIPSINFSCTTADKVVFYAAVYRAFDTAKSRTQDSWQKDREILALQQGKAETGLEKKTVTSLTKLDETL